MGLFDLRKKLLERQIEKAKKISAKEAAKLKRDAAILKKKEDREKELMALRSKLLQSQKLQGLSAEEKRLIAKRKRENARRIKNLKRAASALFEGTQKLAKNIERAQRPKRKRRTTKKTITRKRRCRAYM